MDNYIYWFTFIMSASCGTEENKMILAKEREENKKETRIMVIADFLLFQTCKWHTADGSIQRIYDFPFTVVGQLLAYTQLNYVWTFRKYLFMRAFQNVS